MWWALGTKSISNPHNAPLRGALFSSFSRLGARGLEKLYETCPRSESGKTNQDPKAGLSDFCALSAIRRRHCRLALKVVSPQSLIKEHSEPWPLPPFSTHSLHPRQTEDEPRRVHLESSWWFSTDASLSVCLIQRVLSTTQIWTRSEQAPCP